MKRNMELIYYILSNVKYFKEKWDLSEYTPEELDYHIKLLKSEGYYKVVNGTGIMTWRGYDLLAHIKEEYK